MLSSGWRRKGVALLSGAAVVTALAAVPSARATAPKVDKLYASAYEGTNGDVWVAGAAGNGDLHLGMEHGTRPAIVEVGPATGYFHGYQVFFVANTGHLYSVGPMGFADTGIEVDAGTSISAFNTTYVPQVVEYPVRPVELAVQSGGRLVLAIVFNAYELNLHPLALGMMPGTSPDLTEVGHNVEVAFQANTGDLWTYTAPETHPAQGTATSLRLGMAPATSPSISTTPGGTDTEIVFQGNTGTLWSAGTEGVHNLGFGMAHGTSPSIGDGLNAGTPPGLATYYVAFQANTHQLWVLAWLVREGPPYEEVGATGLGMVPGTSAQIAVDGTAPSYRVAMNGADGKLWYWNLYGAPGGGSGASEQTGMRIAPGADPSVG